MRYFMGLQVQMCECANLGWDICISLYGVSLDCGVWPPILVVGPQWSLGSFQSAVLPPAPFSFLGTLKEQADFSSYSKLLFHCANNTTLAVAGRVVRKCIKEKSSSQCHLEISAPTRLDVVNFEGACCGAKYYFPLKTNRVMWWRGPGI